MQHIPQTIVLILYALNIILAANQHGKPRDPVSFWSSAFGSMVMLGLLYWGGFFK